MVNMKPTPGMSRPNPPRRPGVGQASPGKGPSGRVGRAERKKGSDRRGSAPRGRGSTTAGGGPAISGAAGRAVPSSVPRGASRPGHSGRRSATNPHARRSGRRSHHNTVRTRRDPAGGAVSFGGVTFSVRALAAVMIMGLAALIFIPTAIQWTEQKREYRAVNAEVVQAEAQVERLEAELEAWNHRDYVASQARSRLGYVEKGETQFSVIDGPELEQEAEAKTAAEGPQKPWSLTLQKEILAADSPPPVREAIQTPTRPVDAEEEWDDEDDDDYY